jgi:hypothetical protein
MSSRSRPQLNLLPQGPQENRNSSLSKYKEARLVGTEPTTFGLKVRNHAIQQTTATNNSQRNQQKTRAALGSRRTALYPVHGQSHGQFVAHCRAIILAIAGQTDTRVFFPRPRLLSNSVSRFAVAANARIRLLWHAASVSLFPHNQVDHCDHDSNFRLVESRKKRQYNARNIGLFSRRAPAIDRKLQTWRPRWVQNSPEYGDTGTQKRPGNAGKFTMTIYVRKSYICIVPKWKRLCHSLEVWLPYYR